MVRCAFKFGRFINRHEFGYENINGPQFNCWLPNGEADAIELKTEEPSARLRVWFNRYGQMEGAFIKFAYQKRDFDPAVIPTQGRLEAGPLLGDLELECSDDEVNALHVGGDSAAPLAKRTLLLIQTPVGRFVKTLRTHFGQCWLEEWPIFDSRRENLQSALQGMSLKWRPIGEGDWKTVEVGDAMMMFTASTPRKGHYARFLTSADWKDLGRLVNEHEPTQAAIQIGLAHEALDRGNLKAALIDAATACEVTIDECMKVEKSVASAFEAFWTLPLRTQLAAIVTARCPDVSDRLEGALTALVLRNRVVHDGWRPDESAVPPVQALLSVLTCLLKPLPFKFPSIDGSNHIAPAESWEEVRRSLPSGY